MLLGASFLKTVFMVASADDWASMRGSFQTQRRLFIDIAGIHNTCRNIIEYSSYIIDTAVLTSDVSAFILTIDIWPSCWQVHWHGAITDNMTKNI